MGVPVTVEELEIVIRAKVGEALTSIQQVISRMDELINQRIPQLQPKLDAAMQKADQVIDRDADKIIASIDRLAEAQQQLNERLAQTADRYDEALDNARDFLGGVIDGMREGMEEVANDTSRAERNTRQYGDTAERVTRRAGSGYSRLTNQIRGMLISMALYKVIDLFSTSVSTAAEEMAKLDTRTNEMLSSYKSSFEYAQMSFGNAILPLLEAAEPLVTKLADGFAEVSNYIGMFFAALNGQTQYNKIVKQTANYLEDTAEAAEEAQRSIAGFDELNIIGQDDTDENKGWTTELVDIPEWMQTIGKYIDAEDLAAAALGASILGLITKVGKLTQSFKSKNDALKDQTTKTKADKEAVEAFAESLVPATSSVSGLIQKLVLLGALTIIPTLDGNPFWQSKETLVTAIDEINEKGIKVKAVPALDLDTLFLPSVEKAKEKLDGLNAYELISLLFPALDLNSEFLTSVDKAIEKIDLLNALKIMALVYPAIDIVTNLAPDAAYITGVINKLGKLVITPLVFPALVLTAFEQSVKTVLNKFIEVGEAYDALVQKLSSGSTSTSTVPQSVLTQTTPEYTDPRLSNNQKPVSVTQSTASSSAQTKSSAAVEYTDPRFEGTRSPMPSGVSSSSVSSGTSASASSDESDEWLQFYEKNKYWFSSPYQKLVEAWKSGSEMTYEEQLQLNNIKSEINNLIEKFGEFLGNLSWNIAGSGISIPIPMAAQGAVSYRPTPLLTGEYAGASMNPEIIAPQSMMYDTVVAANGELVSAMYSMIREVITAIEDNAGGDTYIDGNKVTSTVINGIKAEKRRTGKSPI